MIELSPELLRAMPPDGAFDHLLNVNGKVHREVRNRRTVEFTAGTKRYFIKAQRGCGWGEIFKNVFSARLPIVSARTEWLAIGAVRAAGIQVPALFLTALQSIADRVEGLEGGAEAVAHHN